MTEGTQHDQHVWQQYKNRITKLQQLTLEAISRYEGNDSKGLVEYTRKLADAWKDSYSLFARYCDYYEVIAYFVHNSKRAPSAAHLHVGNNIRAIKVMLDQCTADATIKSLKADLMKSDSSSSAKELWNELKRVKADLEVTKVERDEALADARKARAEGRIKLRELIEKHNLPEDPGDYQYQLELTKVEAEPVNLTRMSSVIVVCGEHNTGEGGLRKLHSCAEYFRGTEPPQGWDGVLVPLDGDPKSPGHVVYLCPDHVRLKDHYGCLR